MTTPGGETVSAFGEGHVSPTALPTEALIEGAGVAETLLVGKNVVDDNHTPDISGNEGNADPLKPGKKSLGWGGTPHRWQVVTMMFFAFVLCNMDKVNMSVAVIPMSMEFGWGARERGLVSAAFFWGYTLTQTPAGYLCTKYGGTRVLLFGVAMWSLGTLIAPPAATMGLTALCLTRLLVGLGEGLAPSAVTNVMAGKIPAQERSRAVSTVFGGLDVGSAVGLLVCGPMIKHFGWPSVFYLFAVLGLVWAATFPLIKPAENIDPEEKIQAEMQAAKKVTVSPPEDFIPWGGVGGGGGGRKQRERERERERERKVSTNASSCPPPPPTPFYVCLFVWIILLMYIITFRFIFYYDIDDHSYDFVSFFIFFL